LLYQFYIRFPYNKDTQKNELHKKTHQKVGLILK